ncbi:hypothetical protein QL285_037027 [Trifolium repens]|nr:hypothetical protein QL285_037027 [Trifolium repens]
MAETLKFVYIMILFISLFLIVISDPQCFTDKDCEILCATSYNCHGCSNGLKPACLDGVCAGRILIPIQ